MAEDHYTTGLVLAQLGGQVLDGDLGDHAIELAFHGWRVFPLRGKIPAIPHPHLVGSPERATCKGECGRQGHGVLDATADYATVNAWWSGPYAGANIGLRLPEGLFVLDIDPRHDGHLRLAELEAAHGKLPETLRVYSGRGDGGVHHYFRRPGGALSSKRLGVGVDVKTSAGYVVAPPSIHPDSGQPYRWERHAVAKPPRWLVELLRPEVPETKPSGSARPRWTGRHDHPLDAVFAQPGSASIADEYSATASWREILEPHGWTLVGGDGDSDGSGWRHPIATTPVSATVRHECLFVYSPNTPFDITEASDPHGYTRFRGYAVLNHGGDLTAAAHALRTREEAVA